MPISLSSSLEQYVFVCVCVCADEREREKSNQVIELKEEIPSSARESERWR